MIVAPERGSLEARTRYRLSPSSEEHGEVAGAVGVVAAGSLDDVGQARRRGGRRREAGHLGAAGDATAPTPNLDEVAGLGPSCRSAVPVVSVVAAPVVQEAVEGSPRLLQRLVGAVDQERLQRRVGRDVGRRQARGREHDHAQHEPRAQRQACHARYSAAGVSSM